MKIEYLGDAPIPGYGEWTSKSLEDWLHPEHGPLPDGVHLVEAQGEAFRVAVWAVNTNALVTAVEMLDRNRLKEEQIAADGIRGQVLFTIRWVVDEGDVKCWNRLFPLPIQGRHEGEERWKQRIMELLATESVRVAMDTPICPNNELFKCESTFKASHKT